MIDIKFTLAQLQTFLAVVDHGSFSAAARALDRAQSAVSHSISQLEAHLEVELFERSGRTPVLTSAGAALAEEARRLILQARELETSAETWKGLKGQAQFSLVVDMIYPVNSLVAVLAALQQRHPRLALTVHTEARGAVTARLLQDNCQLGVTGILLTELPNQVETLPIGTIDFVAVAAPSHPLAQLPPPHTLTQLRQHTQIVLEDRRAGRQARPAAGRFWLG
jgi:DNA-binding transcriptional LysR family regulator